MKTASFSIAILNFFSRHGQYFHPTKDQPRTRPSSTFLYICYNFRQIFCTNVIQFFSVENMGNNQLKKCSKYHLVSLLNEKQGSTFANFWHLFIHVTLLTHSAVVLLQPNVKSLKIAAAVNDVNKKLVIGEVVKQFNLGGSCRLGEEVTIMIVCFQVMGGLYRY